MTRNYARWRRALPSAAKPRGIRPGRLDGLRPSELILAVTVTVMVIALVIHSFLSAAP